MVVAQVLEHADPGGEDALGDVLQAEHHAVEVVAEHADVLQVLLRLLEKDSRITFSDI